MVKCHGHGESAGGGKMRVWLASVILLFTLAQLFQWMKQLSVPLPVFILGGACLAIASNYDKRSGWPFHREISQFKGSKIEAPTASDPTEIPETKPVTTIWRPEDK